jgi:hypothetical protein
MTVALSFLKVICLTGWNSDATACCDEVRTKLFGHRVVGMNPRQAFRCASRALVLTDYMSELPLVRAPRIPVTDTFHGVDVTEDYRWLEDASADETVAWTRAQQDRSATYFGEIGWRTALRARVEQLLKFEKTAYQQLRPGGWTFFALKVQTPRQQPFLFALTDLDNAATERVVVDPDAIDPSGQTTIDFFVPSRMAPRSPSPCLSTAPRTGRCTFTTSAPERSWTSPSRT